MNHKDILVYARCPECKEDVAVMKNPDSQTRFVGGTFLTHTTDDSEHLYICDGAGMTAVLNASDRRFAGIKFVTDTVIPEPESLVILMRREDIMKLIDELMLLGRTKQWKAAVYQWGVMVKHSKGIGSLRWAVLQGAIYAGHAA